MSGFENHDQFGAHAPAKYNSERVEDNFNLNSGRHLGRGMGMGNDGYANAGSFGTAPNPTTGFDSSAGTGIGMGVGSDNFNSRGPVDDYGGGFTGPSDPMMDPTTGTATGSSMGASNGRGDDFDTGNTSNGTGNEFDDSTQPGRGNDGNDEFNDENQASPKPSMAQKVKGTMDQVVGKLTGNQTKVEKGRGLKTGTHSNA